MSLCQRRGLLGDETECATGVPEHEQGLLPFLYAASIQGLSALGSQPGARIERLGIAPERVGGRAVVIKELCAELDGFSLHAAVRIDAGRTSRLEHLCRYIARPPLSNERLSLSRDGKVILELRAPFRDGTTHFVFEPLVFVERLAALVPPPRMHQLTYHGVLAPGASWRSDIVPAPTRARRRSCDAQGGRVQPCHRYTWAELLQRVFAVDVLKCSVCGSRRRWIAAITEPDAIRRILEHLGLESVAPAPAPARAPPQLELAWEGC